MGFIDCDTHILETEATWDYMDPSERHFRPAAVRFEGDSSPGPAKGIPVNKTMWLVQDTFARQFQPGARPGGYGKEYSPEIAFLTDPSKRIAEMDLLGIDVQIMISTFFISVDIDHPLAEAAVARSFNRFAADRSADSNGRLRWLVVPPTKMLDRAIAELEFAKDHGAAGIMIKGYEHNLFLDDPYFYPLYEKAQELELTMCVHAGTSLRRLDVPIGNLLRTQAALLDHTAGTMRGFWTILTSDFHKRFPRLKWAFLESGSTWVPLIFQQQQRLQSTSTISNWRETDKGTSVEIVKLPAAELMEEKNLYVACETDEDIPYLTGFAGPNRLVFGSDYCHNDAGSDPLGHSLISSRSDLLADVAARIVDTNGRELFGIDADFRPTAQRTGVLASGASGA